ncbi:MAG TPA: TIGR00159 family protein [Chloroflexi bacterium]|nr:TIGR00159 family protein [Chloroflexota bacterium]
MQDGSVLDFLQELAFIFERLNWTSVLDISLVTLIFFLLLLLVRKTQAMTLLRGVIFLIIALLILTQVVNLPAFRWLIVTAMPTLLFAVPVIFAPEIRRGLQRIGRTGVNSLFMGRSLLDSEAYMTALQAVMMAVGKLSERKHGALMVLQRNEYLEEYVDTGVRMDAQVTAELLLQIFFPNTPLHDGAVIIDKARIVAAACVLPLSSSGVLSATPERKMGLRHRAALGIAESSDALVVIVSEETGSVSIAQQGELIHDISLEELEVELMLYYHLQRERTWRTALKDVLTPNQLKTDPDVFDEEENE